MYKRKRSIERVVNRYITGTLSNHCPQGSLPTSPIFYFKLPYIGHFSFVTQKKIRHFIKRYCNDLDIKLVFSSFKDGAYYCYCAYVLRISRYSDFLSLMLTNTEIFLRGLKLSRESRY